MPWLSSQARRPRKPGRPLQVCRHDLLVVGILRGDDGRVAREHEMGPRARYPIHLEFHEVDSQRPSQRSETVSDEMICGVSQPEQVHTGSPARNKNP